MFFKKKENEKAEEKKPSKITEHGRKLHERIISGVVAMATCLSLVPVVPDILATELDNPGIETLSNVEIPEGGAVTNPDTIRLIDYEASPSYSSTLTGNTHYLYVADFAGSDGGVYSGVCMAPGAQLDINDTSTQWGLSKTWSRDTDPFMLALMDYYWAAEYETRSIEEEAGTKSQDVLYPLYGDATDYKNSALLAGNFGYSTEQQLKIIRSQIQATVWWFIYAPSDADKLQGYEGNRNEWTSIFDYTPDAEAQNAITKLAVERVLIDSQLFGTTTSQEDAEAYIKRMIFWGWHAKHISGITAPYESYNFHYYEYENPNSPPPTYQPFMIGVPLVEYRSGETYTQVGARKVDENGNPLAGATFGLYLDAACTIVASSSNQTSNSNGEVTWTINGDEFTSIGDTITYYVKETSAPPNYKTNSSSYSVTGTFVDIGDTATITWANGGAGIPNEPNDIPETPDSGLIKQDAKTGAVVGPATFRFTGYAYTDIYEENIGNGDLAYRSDVLSLSSGYVDFVLSDGTSPIQWNDPSAVNYIAPGKYEVTELVAPPGYQLTDEVIDVDLYVVWNLDKEYIEYLGPETIVMKNEPLHKIEILKQNSSGVSLEGAVFEIWHTPFGMSGGRSLVSTVSTGSDGKIIWAGDDGLGCSPGYYELIEIQAPDGYILPTNNTAYLTISTSEHETTTHSFIMTNYELPEISLFKTNTEGVALSGAVFEFTLAGINLGTRTTDQYGKINISPNEYSSILTGDGPWNLEVVEISPPSGYIMDEDEEKRTQSVQIIKGDTEVQFQFINKNGTTVLIEKRCAETNDPLPGAVFKVWIDGFVINSVITGDDGLARIDYETYGDFLNTSRSSWSIVVEEIAAPGGYMLSDDDDMRIQYGEVIAGQTLSSFVFLNEPIPKIKIYKQATDGTPLAGAVYDIDIDGYDIKGLVTNEYGEIIIAYDDIYDTDGTLLYDGFGKFLNENNDSWSVKVTEVTPPYGYLLPDDPDMQIQTGEFRRGQKILSFVFTNEPIPKVRITKRDASDGTKYLPGAVYDVKIDDYDIRGLETDENGQIIIDFESHGAFLDITQDSWTVIVEEVSPPPGYMFPFEVDDQIQTGELHRGQSYIDFIFLNQPYPSIKITKTDVNGVGQPGATYDIWIDGNVIKGVQSGEDGVIYITYEEYGEFLDKTKDSWSIIVEEVAPPSGFLLPFDDDMRIQYGEIKGGQSKVDFVFINERVPSITIFKRNIEGEGLPGAVYDITIDDHEIKGVVTGDDGYFIIDYDTYKNFVDISKDSWTVIVKEVTPPDGYLLPFDIDEQIQYGELQGGQDSISFVFTNERVPEIKIFKRNVEGVGLPGAVYDIWIDGHEIKGIVTGDDGYAVIDYDSYAYFVDKSKSSWSVVVKEITPPSGYLLPFDEDEQIQYGELIGGQGTLSFVFTNERAPGIRILKRNIENVPLEGAVYDVTVDGHEIKGVVTGEDGYAIIDYETYGYFIDNSKDSWSVVVKEITPPDGYLLPFDIDEQIQTAELIGGQGTLDFVFTNEKVPQIRILKRNIQNEPLPGAVYDVTIDGHEIKGVVTADDGYAIIDYETYAYFVDKSKSSWSVVVKEVTPPDGYLLPFDIDEQIQTAELIGGQGTLDFVFTNEKVPQIRILKRNIENVPLEGAVYDVTIDGHEIKGVVTGEDGYAIIDYETYAYYVDRSLASWSVVVKEVTPPDGYLLPFDIDEQIQTAELIGGQGTLDFVFTNEKVPEIRILKRNVQNEPLEGAVYDVTIDGHEIKGVVTGEDGYAIIDYDTYAYFVDRSLASWSVVVKEVMPPDGYLLPFDIDEQIQFGELIGGQGILDFVFTNEKVPEIRIYKRDVEGNGLPGAVYDVWIDGHDIRGVETDEFGEVVIAYDDYKYFVDNTKSSWSVVVEEVEAPSGYLLPLTDSMKIQKAELIGGQGHLDFIFVNEKIPEIIIQKTDREGNPLENAIYTVWIDGYAIYGVATDETGIVVIDYDTYADFVNVDRDSWSVIVEEVTPPSGYLLPFDDDMRIQYGELRGGQDILTFQFINELVPEIRITKVDRETNGLPGAVYDIVVDGYDIKGQITDENGEIVIAFDDFRDFLDYSRDSWTVTVTEVMAPYGYLLPDTGDVTQTAELRGGQYHLDFVFINEKVPEIHIYKRNKDNEPLSGATYDVWIDGHNMKGLVTDDEGLIVISHDKWGDFVDLTQMSWSVIVEEVSPPAGYLLPFDDSDKIQYGELYKGQTHLDFIFINEKVPEIRIYKVDEKNQPLEGAIYSVWIDGYNINNVITNEDGEFIICYDDYKDFVDNDQDTWSVVVEEVTPPPGYFLPEVEDRIQYGELRGGQFHLDFYFVNYKIPEIHIYKSSADTGEALSNAYFDVWIDETNIGSFKTDNDGIITVTYEEFGHYLDISDEEWVVKIEETQAPPGYILPVDTVFSKRLDIGMEKLVFELSNSQYPMIEINKYEADTNLGLSGAMFDVKIDTSSLGSFETDENGKIFITYDEYKNFLPGSKESWTVTVEEVSAPAGYINDNAGQPVSHELRLGQSLQTFVFYNSKYPDVIIRKVDREDLTLGLSGAIFSIKVDGVDIPGPWITDENGEITLSWDTVGRYLNESNTSHWTITATEISAPSGYNWNVNPFLHNIFSKFHPT